MTHTGNHLELRREVYRDDVQKLLQWLRDTSITTYLNEDQNIDQALSRLLLQSTLPLFSASFNRDGLFYMLDLEPRCPIGFLRLVSRGNDAEIVVAIGERRHWGQGLGYEAVRKGVRHALLEWRKKRVIAKIHHRNSRSKRLFRKAGFIPDKDLGRETRYSIGVTQFLQSRTT